MDGHRCCLVKSLIIHTDQLTDVCIISTGGRFTAVEGNVYKTPFVVNNREEKKKIFVQIHTCSVISCIDPAWDLVSASFNLNMLYIYKKKTCYSYLDIKIVATALFLFPTICSVEKCAKRLEIPRNRTVFK